jgi:CRISPR/Cas system-associated endoribonuclease Cas2
MNVTDITFGGIPMEKRKWIVLNYTLPTEPSRHRVAIWRALKKLGAVNIQQSMWVLGYNESNYLALQKICQNIEANAGEAFLMESVFFDKEHEEKVLSIFNDIRNDEYTELIEECKKYLKELEKEIFIEKFTFSELEEEEEEWEKLVNWQLKIEVRDIFGAEKGKEAKDMREQIQKAFENYCDLVYQHQQNV